MSSVPAEVADGETLHRLLDPNANAIGPDGSIHYMAFYSNTLPHRISVDRANYRSVEESLQKHRRCGLAAIGVEPVRGLPFDPRLRVQSVVENDNDAHAEIIANEGMSKKSVKTKVCVKLAEIATLVQRCVAGPD